MLARAILAYDLSAAIFFIYIYVFRYFPHRIPLLVDIVDLGGGWVEIELT